MADTEALLGGIHTSNDMHDNQDPAFTAQWQEEDTTQLAPSHLAVARVRRAWDRKPLSPLSRQKLRVGKIWKRAVPRPAASGVPAQSGLAGGKRARVSSPGKPVKKLKLDAALGLGARVSRWEAHASPERKIVTRSAPVEELVELEDEEEHEIDESEEDGDVTIELFGEDGEALGEEYLGGEVEAAKGWEDVEAEETWDPTMTHLLEAVSHAPPAAPTADTSAEDAAISSPARSAHESDNASRLVVATTDLPAPVHFDVPALRAQPVVLPEGFVSPVKQRRKLGPRTSRTVSAARRQTLPVQFAPAVLQATNATPVSEEEKSVDANVDAEEGAVVDEMSARADTASENDARVQNRMSEEGDRMPEVEKQDLVNVQGDAAAMGLDIAGNSAGDDEWEDVEEQIETTNADDAENEVSEAGAEDVGHAGEDIDMQEVEPSAGLDSPVPSIDGPHPRLPLRRSPRRQSSSPLKRSALAQAGERPHFVAFTPLKRLPDANMFHTDHNATEDITGSTSHTPTTLVRASSAPPESPQISPRKMAKPRISDDTALLQAFLNRAAESKTTRRLSASEKESLTNRRDSDTVRQALASPAKLDVLAEMDPNTPSPRRAAAELDTMDWKATQDEEEDQEPQTENATNQETADEQEEAAAPKRNRSGRTRKKPQVYSQSQHVLASSSSSSPARITIRGSGTNNFEPKKTEAQERMLTTRRNTKNNKAGAVMPKMRLVKIAALQAQEEAEKGETDGEGKQQDVVAENKDGKKGIRWAETLVEFYQGGNVDFSDLGDEPEERMPWERGADFDPTVTNAEEAEVPAPVPAAETPSKPKARLRKLRAPSRTATNDVAAPKAEPAADLVGAQGAAVPKDEKPKAKPRKSRIATPAKGSSGKVLLPSGLPNAEPVIVPAVVVPLSNGEKKAPAPATKKRTATSRLPAPGSIALGSAVPTIAPSNTLTSSPAKKARSKTASSLSQSSSSKAAMPKLDFGLSDTMKPPSSNSFVLESDLPGLQSPAKKPAGKRSVLGFSQSGAGKGVAEEKRDGSPVLGLASPAKRTRRKGF